MATISTPAFRILLEEFGGCDLYGSEMINAASLLTGGPFESYYVMAEPVPEKLIHQLVGGDLESLWKAAAYLDGIPGFGIDLNMGCSAPEIIRAGGGVRWMRSIDAARSLVAGTRARVKHKRLSVKLRLGEQEDPEYLLAFCQALVAEGIDFLTLHPRTRKDKFRRIARWEYVRLLKEHLPIPVIGNGDVRTYDDYCRVRARYCPDGVMIGRAAVRSPWIFSYIRYKEGQQLPASPFVESWNPFTVNLRAVILRFLDLLPQYQPREFLESRAKRFLQYVSGNLVFGHRFFTQVWNASGWEDLRTLVDRYFSEHPEEVVRVVE
ncbi:MAG: tRNA-dihydrouridine synthase family protein [Spirochaetes bacterium]|nr:tRNA-dihydrouridine synthase family protein [Spirochaetota bacterium]